MSAETIELFDNKYSKLIEDIQPVCFKGYINQVVGLLFESNGPRVPIGEMCHIKSLSGKKLGVAEVVGFRENQTLLMPLGELKGVSPGTEVTASGSPLKVPVGPGLLGRVIDAFGNPIDGKGPIDFESWKSVDNASPKPMERKKIREPLVTGVRSIDAISTLGKGQRIGIFAGSGVGKSVLMGMIARNTTADVTVIGLIGERGREVREFIEQSLGEEGLKRSVVVVVTSDQAALLRVKGAFTATTIAEYFRELGRDVIFLMDSATRVAMAQREIGLSVGEPPATKGYPPSVFAMLPKLLERAGASDTGSITGIYTVLVEGDDITEPVSDAMRSILDGHVVLTRQLSSRNHYPAIDVLTSISRVMLDVTSEEHQEATGRLLDLVTTYRDSEDLINIGAYAKGSNPKIDKAIELMDSINEFLKQGIFEKSGYEEGVQKIINMV